MPEANIRIPGEAADRLTAAAATEGLSLRAYLIRLAGTLPLPAGRAEPAKPTARSGNRLSPAEIQELDGELDRRLARATAPRGDTTGWTESGPP
ncbi:hypothetical protein ACIQ9E_12035 [Streptomyces sp. NPDC094448]|uniref:hypothetical protein n=1 Tax=Streptomyces sp. NPDC094448 TaxID=3366063 RepID=UPI003813373F